MKLSATLALSILTAVVTPCMAEESSWIVQPYLQNPAKDAMTICWISTSEKPGKVYLKNSPDRMWSCEVTKTPEIDFSDLERSQLPADHNLAPRFLHRVRVTGLEPNTTYEYCAKMESQVYCAQFSTAPDADQGVRFIIYSDSETEPESTGKPVEWPAFGSKEGRLYVVDQTEGYRQNLAIIQQREPDFIAIAGDLVEKGGRQQDWDEFWKHNAGSLGSVASTIPLLPAIGNHENYAGSEGAYSVAGARRSISKFQAYFETPDNGTDHPKWRDRFYRFDYGPVSLITIDSSDGSPHGTSSDSNYLLQGEHDSGDAPDFNPGSAQYHWLEQQLAQAAQQSKFVFVQFHHVPYSVGVHGLPAGEGAGLDTQSGQPLRVLTPLFEKYQVAAVFCGHDEIYEHSIVNGIHFFDVGIGGDGLRGPATGDDGSMGIPSTNPHQVFLAHLNATEVWEGKRLIEGGKHYGHLEVNVSSDQSGWKAECIPVIAFPLMDENGKVQGFERRVYADTCVIRR